jgi:hypothetical protein
MKKLAILAGVLLSTTAAANAHIPQLLDTLAGKWAINGECNVPSKTYVAIVNFENGNIAWQDGLGNTDLEHVIYSNGNEFRTVTLESYHAHHGNSYGTGWVYTAFGSYDAMRIVKLGKVFISLRCS